MLAAVMPLLKLQMIMGLFRGGRGGGGFGIGKIINMMMMMAMIPFAMNAIGGISA